MLSFKEFLEQFDDLPKKTSTKKATKKEKPPENDEDEPVSDTQVKKAKVDIFNFQGGR